ncbi:MAG: B12-binding domain-containing radical SAM protein [Syntrophobacteria bacterium]
MARVLLLNPPGRSPYLRDYYCSKVAKAAYLYEPTDLLVLSGLLAEENRVQVLDCIAEKIRAEAALRRIAGLEPEAVVFLSGAVSWPEDRVFLEKLKRLTGAALIGSGDLFLEGSEQFLRDHWFLDALLLDFTSDDLVHYLRGEAGKLLPSIVYRRGGEIVSASLRRPQRGTYQIPPPRHDLFPHRHYRYPTVRRRPFATVLTDYGCPYSCRFCVMATLGYKVRPVANVVEELGGLARKGFREIYFNDQTFGALRERALELCRAMERFCLGWQGWTRVDLVDEEILAAYRAAGCHSLLFGVESANPQTLAAQKKGYGPEQARRAFSLCREFGIRTLATFIIGLPGETEDHIHRSIDFALELEPDFASFNVLVPRAGTEVRREALTGGWIKGDGARLDQSGTVAVTGSDVLSAETVHRLKSLAMRRFYGRAQYWRQRFRQLPTPAELECHARSGVEVLRKLLLARGIP